MEEFSWKRAIIGVIIGAGIMGSGILYYFEMVDKPVSNIPASVMSPGTTSTVQQTVADIIANEPDATVPPQSIFSNGLFQLGFEPAYKEASVRVASAKNLEALLTSFGKQLSPAQTAFLDAHHFLLLPVNETAMKKRFGSTWNFDEFLNYFDAIRGDNQAYYRKPENAKLVTPDVVLHAYHRFFENTLEELEKRDLNSTLEIFLAGLYDNVRAARSGSYGELKTHYDRLLAQVTTARVLLENQRGPSPDSFASPQEETAFENSDKSIDSLQNAKKILAKYQAELPVELAQKTAVELGLIYGAKDVTSSPLFAIYNEKSKADYTQYTPRSHYTKSSALRAYFRTMMFLGRNSYNLSHDIGWQDANLLTALIGAAGHNGQAPLVPWKKIMAATGFYAGQSDDLTYNEWLDFEGKTFSGAQYSPSQLVGANIVTALQGNLGALRLPKILSEIVVDSNIGAKDKNDLLRESLSFRIFGQRFTYDAWILNQLTAGEEATSVPLPSTPSALFVPAVFGNETALVAGNDFLQKTDSRFKVESNVLAFDQKLLDVALQVKAVSTTDWYGSMQSAWDFTLASFRGKYSGNFPSYMKDEAFPTKEVQTVLGSYTELKHDTVLYAKQSYAELGGGSGDVPPMPPVVRGFVEPNLLFWRRISALIDYTKAVFDQHHLLSGHQAQAELQEFKEIVDFYTLLAEKELRGQPITDDEYEKLRVTSLSFIAKPFDGNGSDEETSKTALVTDVHTDAVKGQILYEATGEPYLMIALVGNENDPRAVIGPVFNHYEFTGPIGPRMTDEEWRGKVYSDKPNLPVKNDWYRVLEP